jgi:hypothetical protein
MRQEIKDEKGATVAVITDGKVEVLDTEKFPDIIVQNSLRLTNLLNQKEALIASQNEYIEALKKTIKLSF